MKNNKVKDYLAIISVPVIFIAITIFILIYNYFTQKIPNTTVLYGLVTVVIFVNIFFLINNVRDYKNGKL